MNTTKLFKITAPNLNDRFSYKTVEVLHVSAARAMKTAQDYWDRVHGLDTYDTGLLKAECLAFVGEGQEPGFRVLWEGEELHPGDLEDVVLVDPYAKVEVS